MKVKLSLLLILVLFLAVSKAQIISTFAGNGTAGYSGDNGLATSAQLRNPFEVASDNYGNIFIADAFNNVIRKVDKTGTITTFAGTGTQGYSGDGGLATSARLYYPYFIGVDKSGNVYFDDQNGSVIRKVDLSGTITSVTGNLPGGYSGDGGPLIMAQFSDIAGISFDNANNMYITDFGNSVIRKVNAAGIITTFAGNGIAGNTGDGGLAINASIRTQSPVAIDNNNNVYIVSHVDSKIRVVDPSGIINTFAGTGVPGYSGDGGPAIAATFNAPWHICFDTAGNMFVPDYNNIVIRKIDKAGNISTYAGNGTYGYSGDGGPALMAQIADPCGTTCDNAGNLYVVQRDFQVVRKISPCLLASITQQPTDTTICNSGNAQFSVNTTNATMFQWQANTGTGWNDITDNATYSGSSTDDLSVNGINPAMNTWQYRCVVSNSCGAIFSLPALLTVNAPATPSININSSETNICAGDNVIFSATFLNAGSSPSFQWTKNGIVAGTNSSTYNDNAFNNGDIIECLLTSSNSCLTNNSATSNSIVINVSPLVTPTISISASTNNICPGETINFTSTNSNAGASPGYTWFVNGTNLFLNSPTFASNTLQNGDQIICVMRSSFGCVTSSVVVSNPILVSVNPAIVPAITITASTTKLCKGEPASFNATPVNGGTAPVFEWQKNGLPAGSGSTNYTDSNISNGDVISCILTSNAAGCLSNPTVTSNTILLSLYPVPIVMLDHNNSLCSGDSRVLDAGVFSSYLWNDGSTGRTLSINNVGAYYVTVKDENGCIGSDTTNIDSLLPKPDGFAPADTAICSYGSLSLKAQNGYKNYLWNTGFAGPSLTITQPGYYWIQVTDYNNCQGKDTVKVLPKECMVGFYIPNAFTPNHDGKNDDFKPLLFGNVIQYSFTIYDRWGQIVFQTTTPLKGWDGRVNGIEKDPAVFVWICNYQFEGEEKKAAKGTVALIR
jgi:gliding motility-associated-like protein